MPTFLHDEIHFHYRDTGSGVPFVFQHGLGADVSQTFDLFTPPPGFRLLSFDCRAHGETRPVGDPEKISIDTFADDLRALLDHLNIARTVVGGISMGAATALTFALRHPGRTLGLVLSRPAWLDESRAAGMKIFPVIAQFIRQHGAWEGAQRFQQTETFQEVRRVSPDNAASLLGQFAHPRAAETAVKLERIPAHVPAHPRAAWRNITVPTLVLANRRDAIHPFEFGETFAREIPGAEFRELTPKSVSKEQHEAKTQQFIADFLVRQTTLALWKDSRPHPGGGPRALHDRRDALRYEEW